MHRLTVKRAAESTGPGIKRPLDETEKVASRQSSAPRISVDKHLLSSLGGGWDNTPPFSGDEDRLYRWMAEPALWARITMRDVDPRTQQRLVGLHAALHDTLDASGFMLWRKLEPRRTEGLTVTLGSSDRRVAPQRLTLPCVSLKQSKLVPSSRYGADWELRSFAGSPAASPTEAPPWLMGAWRLIQDATFPFLGHDMKMVDQAWAADRFSRTDAITHALVATSDDADAPTTVHTSDAGSTAAVARPPQDKGSASRKLRGGGRGSRADGAEEIEAPASGASSSHVPGGRGRKKARGGGSPVASPRVMAAALETPFAAERLLRSLVAAGKDDDVLYIDAIVADRYGAAYRLLCDLVAARQALHPERRLVVVLMAVVSSDVVGRYKRWGFSYGGVMGQTEGETVPLLVDRVDRLHSELQRFEAAMARAFAAPSPTSVVNESI